MGCGGIRRVISHPGSSIPTIERLLMNLGCPGYGSWYHRCHRSQIRIQRAIVGVNRVRLYWSPSFRTTSALVG